jgi:hypothetical protein
VIFVYMCIMYFDQIHPSVNLSHPPSPLFKQFLVRFIILLSYLHMKYFDGIYPHFIFSFLPPPHPQTVCILHSCHKICVLNLDPAYEGEYVTLVFLSLACFAQYDNLHFQPIPADDTG